MTENQKQSSFNMATAYLQRIDQILYACQESAGVENVDLWMTNLRQLRRELSVKLTDEEMDYLTNKIIEVTKLMSPELKLRNRGLILAKLDEIDLWMRKKLQERGMLLIDAPVYEEEIESDYSID